MNHEYTRLAGSLNRPEIRVRSPARHERLGIAHGDGARSAGVTPDPVPYSVRMKHAPSATAQRLIEANALSLDSLTQLYPSTVWCRDLLPRRVQGARLCRHPPRGGDVFSFTTCSSATSSTATPVHALPWFIHAAPCAIRGRQERSDRVLRPSHCQPVTCAAGGSYDLRGTRPRVRSAPAVAARWLTARRGR